MKLPKAACPRCARPIAAGPVSGRLSKGRIWRHDDPGVPRIPGEPLVSCPGSLEIVEMPRPGQQLEFDVPETAPDETAVHDEELSMALF
ncbi:hypothetical protein [Streptomyces sp. NBC_00120]|uniref:hypothetical protein n=1 Tax=Streptomyces sp. NBC_00120 TaxID=2975660 RepID=UPI0022503C63|nr:hypothetical protein [Streptomyces sp. NBC_00120]MCX5326290.1 hypothetical protein [Streptomyces sp. NBC_00120]